MKKLLLIAALLLPIYLNAQVKPDNVYGINFNRSWQQSHAQFLEGEKTTILISSEKYRIVEIDPETKEVLNVYNKTDDELSNGIGPIYIFPDGKRVLTANEDILDLESGKFEDFIETNVIRKDYIGISNNGEMICRKYDVSGVTFDCFIRILQVETKEYIDIEVSIEELVDFLFLDYYFNKDNNLVICLDNEVRTYNSLTGDLIETQALISRIICTDKENDLYLTSSDNNNFFVFDKNATELFKFYFAGRFDSVMFSKDGKRLFISDGGEMSILSIQDQFVEKEFLIPDDSKIVDVSKDNDVLIQYPIYKKDYSLSTLFYDFSTGKLEEPCLTEGELLHIEGDNDNIYILENHYYYLNLKSLTRDEKILNWQLNLYDDKGHYQVGYYYFMKMIDDHIYLNVIEGESLQKYIFMINKNTGKKVNTIGPFDETVNCIDVWNNKLLIGTGEYDSGGLHVWDPETKKEETFIDLQEGVWNLYLIDYENKAWAFTSGGITEVNLINHSIQEIHLQSYLIDRPDYGAIYLRANEGRNLLLSGYSTLHKFNFQTDKSERIELEAVQALKANKDESKIFAAGDGKIVEIDFETLEITNEYGGYPESYKIDGVAAFKIHFNDIDIHGDKLIGVTSDGCLIEYTLQPTSVPRYLSGGKSNVLVYPNPVSAGGKINIDFQNEEYTITSAELLDLTSNLIQRYKTTSGGRQSINLDGIAPGVYFLKLSTNKGLIVQKLVVM